LAYGPTVGRLGGSGAAFLTTLAGAAFVTTAASLTGALAVGALAGAALATTGSGVWVSGAPASPRRPESALGAVLPEFPWRQVGGAAKRARETCLRREAGSERDFTQGKLAGGQHSHCRFEPSAADVAMRRHTYRSGEHSREMEWTEAGLSRQIANGEFFFKVMVNIIQYTSHSGAIEAISAAGDAIGHVSVNVTLDEARREHEGRSLRKHAACRCLLRELSKNRFAHLSDQVVIHSPDILNRANHRPCKIILVRQDVELAYGQIEMERPRDGCGYDDFLGTNARRNEPYRSRRGPCLILPSCAGPYNGSVGSGQSDNDFHALLLNGDNPTGRVRPQLSRQGRPASIGRGKQQVRARVFSPTVDVPIPHGAHAVRRCRHVSANRFGAHKEPHSMTLTGRRRATHGTLRIG